MLKNKHWLILKELVFDKQVAKLERLLLAEAKSPEVQIENIYKLQGELTWAKRYADLSKFAEQLKKELEGIKQKI